MSQNRSTANDRGAVQLVDVVMTFFLLVAVMALAPQIYFFINLISANADGFSEILLQIAIPMLLVGLLVSIGVSARRGGVR